MPEIPAIIIILVIPAVVGLVTMLKDHLGLSSRWAGPIAVLLGVAAMVAYSLWGDLPLFENVLIGVLIGLGAAGFYDLAKLTGIGGAK